MTVDQLEGNVDVVIVGAGFAGIYMLHRARRAGLSAIVFETGAGVGGTWYFNRYPGARCDFESFDYSYEFDDELQTSWRWSERYPSQPEIRRYLEHVVDRHDLRADIHLEHRVVSARYSERDARWQVTATNPAGTVEVDARYFVLATGTLSLPRVPELPGLESFRGERYLTADWPEEGVDVSGKRVAVVGTGSSGVQVIPMLAKDAGELFVLQRTPAYVVPARNRPLTEAEHAAFVADRVGYRAKARDGFLGVGFTAVGMSAKAASADERERVLEARWALGGSGMLSAYADVLVDRESNDLVADFLRRKIAETVHDPDTAAALMPRTYPVGGKRIVVDTDYHKTFNEPHVTLVDLRERPLESVAADGVVVGGEHIPLDVLVLATGFDAMTGSILAIDIVGRSGRSLRDAWAKGPDNYLGLQVAGFPNLFTITGPGSPALLSNLVRSIEQHVGWIADLWDWMRERELHVVEPEPTAQEQWTRHVGEIADATLLPTVDSPWVGANVPGKPRVFMPYAGGVPAYREASAEIASDGYRGFAFTASEPASG